MILWLTGNSGAGKTTLARFLCRHDHRRLMLDGDEMRASISVGAGFSKEDREEHNLRVARLAAVLEKQGFVVIVSVIAPFASTRAKIDGLIHPVWVYIERNLPADPNKPYEPPGGVPFINTDRHSVVECAEYLEQIIAFYTKERN